MEIPALTSDFSLLSKELKAVEPDFSEDQRLKLKEYEENLKLLLGLKKVGQIKSRSVGVYEQEQNRIRVERNEGKWMYGYRENNINYLYPHEALYLMDLVR